MRRRSKGAGGREAGSRDGARQAEAKRRHARAAWESDLPHRVGVPVDHLHVLVLRHLTRVLQSIPPTCRDQLSESARVEARAREAEAPVHGVRHNLQGFLANVKLRAACLVVLRLDDCFHLATTCHQIADQTREHAGLDCRRWQLGERRIAILVLGRPRDGGEANVVFLRARTTRAAGRWRWRQAPAGNGDKPMDVGRGGGGKAVTVGSQACTIDGYSELKSKRRTKRS